MDIYEKTFVNPGSHSIYSSQNHSSPQICNFCGHSLTDNLNTRPIPLYPLLTHGSNSYRNRSSHLRSRSRSYFSDRRRSNRYNTAYSRSRSRSYSIDRRRSNRRSTAYSRYRSLPRSSDHNRSYSCSSSLSYSSYSQSSNHSRSQDRSNDKTNRKCLGIFGLDPYTKESHLYKIFEKYGSIDKIVIILHPKTGKSRGFGFMYFKNHEDAKKVIEKCSGMEISGRKVKIEFSISQRPLYSKPGIDMDDPGIQKRKRDAERKSTSSRSRSCSSKKSKSHSSSPPHIMYYA
ncbi:transformer-2 protein homolog beta-like [Melanaphis sacchari]|uniref:transformer-2 protein homolog beta-like n=1 Tax=Melanaphis sacchari TaxID=742174 RepID=UPI000DC14B03|nr:transformer-2 protein homolog beta-like [Melanaphis sacchari]